MHTLALRKKFIARHNLADAPADETHAKSHLYTLEVMLEAEELDSEGYVLELDALSAELDMILAIYSDKSLDKAPGFEGRSPTLERFAQVLCETIDEELYAPQLTAVSVRLWRDENAWAMYDIEK